MVYPHEPAPVPWRAGLGPAECTHCGAATLAAPGLEFPRCDPCRRAAVNASQSSPAWLASLSTLQARFTAEQRNDIEVHTARRTSMHPAVAPVKIRVTMPASTLPVSAWTDRDRVPNGARRLAMNATTYGRQVKLTYALAEDMTAGKQIHSLCVRLWVADGTPFGYAAYVDSGNGWRASSAVLWRAEEGGVRRCGVEEFTALAVGERWTPPAPPPYGPCPTCGKQVRWTNACQPYKHGDCPGLQSS